MSSAASDEKSKKNQCVICLEKIKERGVSRECRSHFYCYTCITEWVTRNTPRCPLCKTIVTQIARCAVDANVKAIEWDKVPALRLSHSVLHTLNEAEHDAYEDLLEEADDASYGEEDAKRDERKDDHIISSKHAVPEEFYGTQVVGKKKRKRVQSKLQQHDVNEDDNNEEENVMALSVSPTKSRAPVSFWDAGLSREPLFSDDDEIIAEDDDDDDTSYTGRDGEYKPSTDRSSSSEEKEKEEEKEKRPKRKRKLQ